MERKKIHVHLQKLLERYPNLASTSAQLEAGYQILEDTFTNGGKLLIAGNGGSAADAEHITGELMKNFRIQRSVGDDFADKLIQIDPIRGEMIAGHLEQGLPTIPLVAHESLTTAFINDTNADCVYAQQLYGYGSPGDAFLGISTSGNSPNIINAIVVAKAMGIKTVALTGDTGGEMRNLADVTVMAPEKETYMIQELHLPIYHTWCMMLEEHFFG